MEAERAGTLREQRTKPTTYRMCRTRKSFYRGTLGFARLRQERERVRVHNIRTPSFQPESPPLSVLLPTSPSAVVSRYTQCEETERVLLNERIVSAVGPIRRKSEQQALPDSFIQFFMEHACTRTEKKRKKERKKTSVGRKAVSVTIAVTVFTTALRFFLSFFNVRRNMSGLLV